MPGYICIKIKVSLSPSGINYSNFIALNLKRQLLSALAKAVTSNYPAKFPVPIHKSMKLNDGNKNI